MSDCRDRVEAQIAHHEIELSTKADVARAFLGLTLYLPAALKS